MADHIHEANRRRWDVGSASWAYRADTRGIWKRCHRNPSLALHSAELKWLSDIAGKSVAAIHCGSGGTKNTTATAIARLSAMVA